jgi:DNA-binding response OmpR family regulator
LSALTDTKDKVQGLDLGAVDYITKPFQPDEVIARVNTHLTVYRLKKALDEKNKELQDANDYYDRKFSESSVKFNQVLEKHPEDRAARIYLKRSANYMVNGVPDDWTGVEVLSHK